LFRRALAEAVLIGGLCGAVGVHVLLRRLAFFAHAAAHAAFPGVVAAEGLPVATATTAVEQLLSALGNGETNQV